MDSIVVNFGPSLFVDLSLYVLPLCFMSDNATHKQVDKVPQSRHRK